jgi:hypothetical protein
VQRERAAAALRRRRDDVAAFSGEDVHRRRVDLRKHDALRATRQQADGQPPLANCGRALGQGRPEKRRERHAWSQRQRGAQARQKSRRGPAPFGLSGLAGPLDPPYVPDPPEHHQRQQRDPEPCGIRHHGEDRLAEPSIHDRSWMLALDLAPRRFDQRRVLHAGWARGHARHAAQARVEMADEAVRHPGAPLEAGLHEIDPAARRVHLFAPQHVRRAGGETEAAVHALVDPVS